MITGENQAPTRQFIELSVAHISCESASDWEENLPSHLLDRRMTSSEIDRRLNAIVALLSS